MPKHCRTEQMNLRCCQSIWRTTQRQRYYMREHASECFCHSTPLARPKRDFYLLLPPHCQKCCRYCIIFQLNETTRTEVLNVTSRCLTNAINNGRSVHITLLVVADTENNLYGVEQLRMLTAIPCGNQPVIAPGRRKCKNQYTNHCRIKRVLFPDRHTTRFSDDHAKQCTSAHSIMREGNRLAASTLSYLQRCS